MAEKAEVVGQVTAEQGEVMAKQAVAAGQVTVGRWQNSRGGGGRGVLLADDDGVVSECDGSEVEAELLRQVAEKGLPPCDDFGPAVGPACLGMG
jgi:hypothetical protein